MFYYSAEVLGMCIQIHMMKIVNKYQASTYDGVQPNSQGIRLSLYFVHVQFGQTYLTIQLLKINLATTSR